MYKRIKIIIIAVVILIGLLLNFWQFSMYKYEKRTKKVPVYECIYPIGTGTSNDTYRPGESSGCTFVKYIPIFKPVYEECMERYNKKKQMYEEGKCSRIYSKKLEYDAGWCRISYTIKNGKPEERTSSGANLEGKQYDACYEKLRAQIFK